ncbi:hypothetical protein JCM10207_005895 [Rhodosporidiobolus poonsookiae]
MSTAQAPRPPTVAQPGGDTRLRLINALVLTALVGTTWSVLSTSAATTAFRSRLPAHTLTRLTESPTAFPVPTLPYFADKRNALNQLFVKQSWAWVTALFLSLSALLFLFHPHHPSTSSTPRSTTPTRGLTPTATHVLASLRRFLLATLFWFYLTQATWFGTRLGPSLAFRILRGSGAVCVPSALSSAGADSSGGLHADGPRDPAAVPVCTGARGEYWRGGHDVSGHAFMMVHTALFLFELVHPLLPALFPRFFRLAHPTSTAAVKKDDAPVDPVLAAAPRLNPLVALAGYATVAVIALSWWMLLMTSLFFHSPAEKLTGLAFGLVGWYVSGL